MLFDSTKTLLRTILQSLESSDQTGWDDHIESGKQCLFEMHQMTRPAYRGYKTTGSDKWPSHVPDGAGLNRAMPHVKAMVSAIRRKDRSEAVESGKAALAELNGTTPSVAATCVKRHSAEVNDVSNAVQMPVKSVPANTTKRVPVKKPMSKRTASAPALVSAKAAG